MKHETPVSGVVLYVLCVWCDKFSKSTYIKQRETKTKIAKMIKATIMPAISPMARPLVLVMFVLLELADGGLE